MNPQVRGIRGATVCEANTQMAILGATEELLGRMLADNQLAKEDIASIFFSVTRDLNVEFPAVAARHMGLSQAALLCLNEISVEGSLERCIRLLIHANMTVPQAQVKHIYLREAARLRPDMVG